MENYGRHFSIVILNEGQLRTRVLLEKIRFRFRIYIESARTAVLVRGLPDQMVSFSPDRDFSYSGKHGVRRTFVVADDGIKKFCVQLDGDTRFGWFEGVWRLIKDFLIRKRIAGELCVTYFTGWKSLCPVCQRRKAYWPAKFLKVTIFSSVKWPLS